MNKEELTRTIALANYGNKAAINRLYDYYVVNQEFEKGFLTLKRLENHLDSDALRKLAYSYLHGLGVSVSIDKAKEYYEKSYELGDVLSGYNLALIYIKEEKYMEALEYLSYGVYQNHMKSTSLLADMYAKGVGVNKNIDIALNLYNKILATGDYKIYDKIGRMYYQEKDYYQAFKYFSLGAKKLDPDALYHLGICYSKGEGVAQDIAKAIYYYDLGAGQNHEKCLKNLILHYEKGLGVPINLRKVEIYKNKLKQITG